MVGRSLLAGLVRAVPVVVADVLAEERSKVPFVIDQHPVGALGSCGGVHPPLGVTVGPWRPRRVLTTLTPSSPKISSKARGEPGVAVPDKETVGAGAVSEVDEQVAGLL